MTADSTPILELENISYVYHSGTTALDDVTLRVYEGDFVCLVGANGSGKSTLVKIIAGLAAPTSGTAQIFGRTAKDAVSSFEIRSRIGYVFQNPDDQLVSSLVEDDVAFGPENLGIPNPELQTRVDNALSSVRMSEYAKSNVNELSGGQKQRIAIASALAMNPDLLLLDEPCSMLDSKASREVMQILAEANNAGCTIIMVTHRMNEALSAKRIVGLSDGRIVADEATLPFFNDSNLLERLHISRPSLLELYSLLIDYGVPVKPTQNKEELEEQLCRLLLTR